MPCRSNLRSFTVTDIRIDLDARRLGLAVMRLSKMEGNPTARTLITKIVRAWDPMYGPVRNDRRYCSVRLAPHEAEVYRSLAIQSLLQCTYAAVYVDPKDPTTEVKVCTEKRPPMKATFNVRGGRRRLVRTSITRIALEENHMARKKSTADVDELDGLDDIDLDDDDEDEDEAPAPKAKSKTKALTPAEKRRAKKLAAEAAAAEEDDEDEDDEEDEDEDDDEDEPAPAAKKSTKSKAKPTTKKKGTPVGRALPEGKFGVEQVAALAGTSGRAVRIYCRTNDIEKAEGLGRYAWTEKAATALAKKIKAGSK